MRRSSSETTNLDIAARIATSPEPGKLRIPLGEHNTIGGDA
jgi:hypothetical protein